jgi:hypothetical protein
MGNVGLNVFEVRMMPFTIFPQTKIQFKLSLFSKDEQKTIWTEDIYGEGVILKSAVPQGILGFGTINEIYEKRIEAAFEKAINNAMRKIKEAYVLHKAIAQVAGIPFQK